VRRLGVLCGRVAIYEVRISLQECSISILR
jgi:hypothetical protein